MWRAGNKAPHTSRWFLLSGCLLIAGAALYALCRPLPWMPWQAVLSPVPDWLRWGLPDGAWTAAFAAALLPLFPKRNANLAIWIPAGYLLLLEALQEMRLWPGTADLLDLVWGAGGCLLIFYLHWVQRWKKEPKGQLIG